MPTSLTRTPFKPHSLLTIGDATTSVSVVPECSAYVHQIHLGGRPLLWNYADGDALARNDGHRNLALLPFPNRLLEGEYAWADRSLAFAVDMPDTRSALHGFGADAPFEVTSVRLGATSATVTLSYLHRASEHPGSYPFDVLFAVSLGVDTARHRASWSLSAQNLGPADAPVGLGWHPYFLLAGGIRANELVMPPNERVVLRRAIPTGERSAGLPSASAIPIDAEWDDCFALTDPARRTVELQGDGQKLTLVQGGDTRYTQLYVPPGDGSVAVEPMTCGVNAFLAAQHEVRLAPGKRVTTTMDIHVETTAV